MALRRGRESGKGREGKKKTRTHRPASTRDAPQAAAAAATGPAGRAPRGAELPEAAANGSGRSARRQHGRPQTRPPNPEQLAPK